MSMRDLSVMMLRMASVSAEASAQIRVEAVRFARDQGVTWDAIGAATGTNRQGAFKRYGTAVGESRLTPFKTTPELGDGVVGE